jgi:hypothetical protein
MGKVQNPSNSEYYTPSSEPFRIKSKCLLKYDFRFSVQCIPNKHLYTKYMKFITVSIIPLRTHACVFILPLCVALDLQHTGMFL